MSRFAAQREVFFLEPPVSSTSESLQIRPCAATGVQVVTPLLRDWALPEMRAVLDLLLARSGAAIAWYASPQAHAFSDDLPWLTTVYDCAGDPLPADRPAEARLMAAADLVFAGNAGLHEDRLDRHPNIHCFPGGIDLEHLAAARRLLPEPEDQIGLPRPLLGRIAPVDNRLDLDLLATIAAMRPGWHFAMIGRIETTRSLPDAPNLHWLGERGEAELPAYLCHWDAAIMPVVRGGVPEADETLTYLAAGRRVIATPVREVTRRFARIEAVTTAGDAESFVAAAEQAMRREDVSDFVAVDEMLACHSWDAVQLHMAALLDAAERHACPRVEAFSTI